MISQPGLRRNWRPFTLLVVINAFVGGMVGLERTLLPEIAEQEFGIAAKSAIFSFIVVFGITKALANYFAGRFAEAFGRKNMLVAGWLFGLPVPFVLMGATDWAWIVAANVLLGVNQGLAWSANVIMKIDLAGEKDRGLAMGLNEFAGYLAVAAVAFLTGWIAANHGLRPAPFYLGAFLAVAGLLMSVFMVRDTAAFAAHESKASKARRIHKNLFRDVSFRHPKLRALVQGGMVTNFTDGLAWGAFPIFLATAGLSLTQIGIVAGLYPAFWGALQIVTGKLSDYTGRKNLLWSGMLVQGLSLIAFPLVDGFAVFAVLSALLGVGTAMVYPTFLAAVADQVHPADRAESIGVYRFWRDAGYAIGAVFSGAVADAFNLSTAIILTGCLTLASAVWLYKGLQE